MYTDIIRYQLAEGITEAQLLEACAAIHTDWMGQQDGLVRWDIQSLGEGKYVDFVVWESKNHADAAQANMKDIDPNHVWFTVYDMSTVSSENTTTLRTF